MTDSPEQKTKSLRMALSVFKPLPEKFKKKHVSIGIYGENVKVIEKQMEIWDAFNREDQNQQVRDYIVAIESGREIIPNEPDMVKAFEDGGWLQGVTHESQTIRPRVNGGIKAEEGEQVVLTGAKYTGSMRRIYDKGSTIIIPLLNTGIWMTLRPARNLEYLGFDEQRHLHRTRFGRESIGIMFGGRSALDKEDILDMALECMIGCNLVGYSDMNLKEVIDVTDLPTIAYGLNLANFYDGYMHSIPCHYNPGKCSHVEEVLLDIRATWWANADRMTKDQKDHMLRYLTGKDAKVTLDDVKKYKAQFSQSVSIEVDEHTTFVLKTPTAQDYFNESRLWIDYVTQEIVRSVGADRPQEEMIRRIEKGLVATELREYGAWIEKIITKVPGKIGATIETTSQEDVYNGLEELSDQGDVIKGAKEKLIEHIGNISVSAIGHPVFVCPKCQDGKHVDDPEFEKIEVDRIVPLDPFKHFFSLTDRKVQSLLN